MNFGAHRDRVAVDAGAFHVFAGEAQLGSALHEVGDEDIFAVAALAFFLQQFVARREPPVADEGVGFRMHHAELKEGGLFDLVADTLVFRLRETGHHDEDAVLAGRLDDGFGDAELVDALAEHFDGVGERGLFHRGLVRAVGVGEELGTVHEHQEGRAALEIESELDLAGGLALEAVQNRAGRLLLGGDIEDGEIAGDRVGADGLEQVFVGIVFADLFFERLLLQRLGPGDDGGEVGVLAAGAADELPDKGPRRGRV